MVVEFVAAVRQEANVGPHRTESEPALQLMLSGRMVLVVTTTLVHLAVLGSGALFGSWRVEDQVREKLSRREERSTAERANPVRRL